ncbi:MAG: RidA family protein [Gammaproteobacteria bacterium]|nr:RidA family protein [Gammaproteobacteria bacterium]MDH3767654.1 RidA family protein [Gammaproteobacteria bacterium]
MRKYLLIVLCLVVGCTTTNAPGPRTEFLSTPEMKAANLPFSDAVRAGKLLFLSGKIGNVPGTMALAPGGIQGETRQTMENIRAALQRYDASLDQVVKCTVFLADMAEWGKMNAVYTEFFPTNKPARSALGASGLALNARVEIECIAALH